MKQFESKYGKYHLTVSLPSHTTACIVTFQITTWVYTNKDMLARNYEHSTAVLIILKDRCLLQNTASKQIQRKPASNLN